jgi:hypothetical protein
VGIVNKRNAVIGWLALKIGTRAAKRKAQGARRRRAGGAAGALGALGALLFWRKKRGGGSAA